MQKVLFIHGMESNNNNNNNHNHNHNHNINNNHNHIHNNNNHSNNPLVSCTRFFFLLCAPQTGPG